MNAREGGATSLGVRASRDAGAHLVDAGSIVDHGAFVADPSLVSTKDGFVLAFLSFRAHVGAGGEPYDMAVMTASSPSTSVHFGALTTVAPKSESVRYDHPQLAVTAGGVLLVVYRYEVWGHAGIAVARSENGLDFQRETVVEGPGFGGTLPSICTASSGEQAFVVYVDPNVGVVARGSLDGVRFPITAVVSRPNEPVAIEGPSCVLQGEDVWVSYGTTDRPFDSGASSPLDAIAVARSSDSGRRFGETITLDLHRAQHALHPRLVRRAVGAVPEVVSYRAREEGDPRGGLFLDRLTAEGGVTLASSLRFVLRRDDPAWMGDYLGVTTSAAGSFAAYVDNGGARARVVLTRLP